MKKEIKKCLNCEKEFVIDANDFSFYEKINVPPPTWCPDCRCIRRMVHRNERNLYRRTCDITGKNIISIYRDDCPYTICDKDYYFSDDFDPLKYSKEYNLNLKFFEQFYEFAKKVPFPSLFVRNSTNCEYNQDMGGSMNCYLCSRTHDSQNMFYTYRGNHSSYCVDCFQTVVSSEFLYECVNVITCSNSKFLHNCEKCSDSSFLFNCTGCVDCFMCTNLRNKQCCYKNEQYSREEYSKIVNLYNLSTFKGQKNALNEFEEFIKKYPRKNLTIFRSKDVIGDSIFDSKDSKYVWNVRDLENCSYIWDSFNFKDSMDTYSGARAELLYEATATTKGASNCRFCIRVHSGSSNCEYSWFLQNCTNCFGCVSLVNKEYCIFNKEYEKNEYEELISKIKEKMIIDKEYGEFFPLYISPFPYNDTVSNEFYPKNEDWAKQRGMKWGSFEEKNYTVTISSNDLPESIEETTDSILKEVISCEHNGDCLHGCTKAFKITVDELSFYRRKKIPIPRECPNCRYYRRLAYRNYTKLQEIKCMCEGKDQSKIVYQNTVEHEHGPSPCGKNIKTTINPDSGQIIYCEECYKKEIY